MTLNVLIAPSGFKESLAAEDVAASIARGVARAAPEAQIRCLPMVDGGEGFTKGLVAATGGSLHEVEVTGPVGQPVQSHFGFLGESGPRTAVLEMAAAAGLRLVPTEIRDPTVTTTFGVGELIRAAMDAGAERILIGCGDSGTNDGGAGMAQALGMRLLDRKGRELGPGGRHLRDLHRIDMSGRDPRLDHVRIDVACNWHNVLCGPKGVARVFGPQKGASPETVEELEAALDVFAGVIAKQLGKDVRTMAGGGASGGLGAGLHAMAGAHLHPRFKIVDRYLKMDSLLREADLVITGEGGIDYQTPRGKIPAEVARRAQNYGLPVIALAGTIGSGAEVNLGHGIASYASIVEGPCSLGEAMEDAEDLVTRAAERMMRLIGVGRVLKAA
ncbi:glycerate kinase [Thalassococcus sp. S3]|uniref:glycerate kinase family protein n=1 Tax=Thalassococcus sp. S3 TaxID=2017482 RepID=UPI0010241475|nr:glycerate kinase [Thalassococcus sp. S3]QBF31106.1 glycerate kinase [Thalassococcus sp. S3]